jgi:hypothetical protein
VLPVVASSVVRVGVWCRSVSWVQHFVSFSPLLALLIQSWALECLLSKKKAIYRLVKVTFFSSCNQRLPLIFLRLESFFFHDNLPKPLLRASPLTLPIWRLAKSQNRAYMEGLGTKGCVCGCLWLSAQLHPQYGRPQMRLLTYFLIYIPCYFAKF